MTAFVSFLRCSSQPTSTKLCPLNEGTFLSVWLAQNNVRCLHAMAFSYAFFHLFQLQGALYSLKRKKWYQVSFLSFQWTHFTRCICIDSQTASWCICNIFELSFTASKEFVQHLKGPNKLRTSNASQFFYIFSFFLLNCNFFTSPLSHSGWWNRGCVLRIARAQWQEVFSHLGSKHGKPR